MNLDHKPQVALIIPDALSLMGLEGILSRMMPGATIRKFLDFESLKSEDKGQFYHYFVSTTTLLAHAGYFIEKRHKTIALVHGNEAGQISKEFHSINVCQREDDLLRSFIMMAQHAHHSIPGGEPEAVRRASATEEEATRLTPRETEVLKLVVCGLINKEIAERLCVSLPTVISHRKNINEKLHTKSVSALTIYAIMHGIVRPEDI